MPKAYWFNINNAFSPLAKICIGKNGALDDYKEIKI